MSRLYFHLRDGIDVVLDLDGSEMSLEKAADRALLEARALIADEATRGRIDLRQRIDVEDERGMILYSISFGDAVQIIPAVEQPVNVV